MGWIEALGGTIVGLDTAPLIYFIEEHPTYLPLVRPFFQAVDRGDFRLVTSVLTLTEALVHPLRRADRSLADQYRRILLHAGQVTTVPMSESVAEETAQLRSSHNLRTPDAIQLAAAIRSQASCYLTSDNRFPRVIGSLRVLVLNQLTPSIP